MVKIERISVGQQGCGEGPHWDASTQSLMFVDAFNHNIHRWDERRQRETKLHISGSSPPNLTADCTSIVIPIQGQPDHYVITRGNRLSVLTWDGCGDGHSVRDVAKVDTDLGFPMRFNDGKCDPEGGLWVGTMGEESAPGVPRLGVGSVYSFGGDGGATKRSGGISVANGLAFSADKRGMFYIDTPTKKVDVFDLDIGTSQLSNRRTVYDLPANKTPGLPDGMTIDTQGRLWVALFFGQRVICLDSTTGQLVQEVAMPACNITSCTFGGADLSTLYVTSATHGLEDWQVGAQPDAGATFRVTGLGARGTPNVAWSADLKALGTV